MLTVACTYFEGVRVSKASRGVFTPEWADRLYRGVRRNYRGDLRFVVVTDEPRASFAEPVETVPFRTYRDCNWCVVECLRVTGDPVLFMGLDTVITGDITHMADHRPRFGMLRDPYHADRMCSGVMMWSDRRDLYETFLTDPKDGAWMGGRPSDQGWLEKHGRPDSDLDAVFPGQIRSYKAHVAKEGLGDARIVYFHGKPKPHQLAEDDPVRAHWI